MPDISVVVPCYNSAAFLATTIQSVLDRDQHEWELILVDDGSTDGTARLFDAFVPRIIALRGTRQRNSGRSRACSFGVTHISSQSTYIFILDSDDQLMPKTLRVMSSYLNTRPDVGLLTCKIQEIDGKGIASGSFRRSRWVPGKFLPWRLSEDERETPFITLLCGAGQGSFALFRTSVFLRTTGFEDALSDWFVRTQRITLRLPGVATPLVCKGTQIGGKLRDWCHHFDHTKYFGW